VYIICAADAAGAKRKYHGGDGWGGGREKWANSGENRKKIIKTHLDGNKFAGEKGAKQKSRIARSGNGR